MRHIVIHIFLLSCCVILTLTAWAKLYSATGHAGILDLPDPLFYSEYFNGTFYRGLKGENLLYYIKQKDFEDLQAKLLELARIIGGLRSAVAKQR